MLLCSLITLLLSILFISSSIGYTQDNVWSFEHSAYFGFNPPIDLLVPPSLGVINDSSFAGYWNLDEGAGSTVHDVSGQKVNGTINNAVWTQGKFGSGLNFLGYGYVECGNEQGLNITGNDITILAWVKSSNSSQQTIVGFSDNHAFFSIYNFTKLNGWWKSESRENAFTFTLPSDYSDGKFHLAALTYEKTSGYLKGYWDGTLIGEQSFGGSAIYGTNNNITIGARNGGKSLFFDGAIDEVRIYHRSLSASDILAVYTQPDPVSLANYYSYCDLVTNNTLLIHIRDNLNESNSTLVACRNFFADNRLIFSSNDTAIINLWTNLGQPVFTSGVWNSQNFTTTLTIDISSIGELDWNRVPPLASNFSTTNTYAGKDTTYSASWSDKRSLSGGGFIFSTNNTGKWVNSTWTAFTSNPNWANVTLTLNNTVGVNVSFREYANNTVGIWGVSENYAIETTALDGTILNPTPSAISTTIPTTSPTTTPNATSLTPTSAPNSETTGTYSTQTILIVTGVVIALLFVVFVLSFKKGIIKIEVVNEQKSETPEIQHDYQI